LGNLPLPGKITLRRKIISREKFLFPRKIRRLKLIGTELAPTAVPFRRRFKRSKFAGSQLAPANLPLPKKRSIPEKSRKPTLVGHLQSTLPEGKIFWRDNRAGSGS
jgi:hypothetical protein